MTDLPFTGRLLRRALAAMTGTVFAHETAPRKLAVCLLVFIHQQMLKERLL